MRVRKTARAVAGVVAAVTIAAGCGPGGKDPDDSIELRIPVVTRDVAARDVDFTVTSLGTVAAWREVTVSAKTSGQILELSFEKGDTVKPKPADGDAPPPLAVIEQQEYKLKWLEAGAAFNEAKRTFERAKRLFEQGSVVESEFDAATSQFEVAQARRDLAKKAYDDTVIYSPIEGTVISKPVEAGELVAPGTPLATVADVRKVKVVTAVAESDSPHIGVGETYPVRVDAFPGRAFEGTIIYKSIKADVRTRSFPVELEVANADGALGIGMVARVTFTLRTVPAAITVPLDALVYWEKVLGVYVIEQGGAVFRPLELGERSGDDVIVAGGLSAGEELVVLGQESLRPGSKITRSEQSAGGAPDVEAETTEPETER